MGILLSEEEMPYPFNYYLSNTNVKVLQERLEALKKAQLRKVVGWLEERRHDCIECGWAITPEDEEWQAFKKELE